MSTSLPGRSVARRVLGVFDAFSAERTELSLSEISRRSGLPLTTAHRLVNELTAWGALERDARGYYRIGLRVWEVTALAPRGLGLREAALPFMSQLTLDALSVAAPVRGPGKEIVAALSIVVRVARASSPALAPLVVAAARGISRAIDSPAIRHPHPAVLGGAGGGLRP